LTTPVLNAVTSCTTADCWRQCANFAGEAAEFAFCGEVFWKSTTRSGSGKATGRNSTAFTTEKIAVFAPIPSVSAASAASENAGFCTNIRSDCLRSLKNDSSM
jgi:hypothetical protein